MKKFLTSAGLVALGVSSLQAAPELTPMEASKPWSISAALRGFYDDNYNTAPSNLADDSFGIEFNPSVSLNLPLDQTFVGASYDYSVKYFEGRRRGGKYDQAHKFNARLDHDFSPRYKLKVDNSFVISKEPDVIATSGGAAFPLRTDDDVIRNYGSIRFNAQVTELLALELGYANTFVDYDQENEAFDFFGNVISTRSGLLDRMEHLASVDLRWQALPDTDGILGYAYQIVDFTGDEFISGNGFFPGTLVSSDDRNSRTHRVYVGADHRFNALLSGSIRVGGQFTDYHNAGDDKASPYLDANLAYQYNRGNTIQVGVIHSRNQTDVTSLDQETTVLYGSITHKITPNLVGSLLVQGQRSEFEGGTADGDKEMFLISGLNLTYHINPHLLAEAGYNFDRLSSDLSDRSYTRNRLYVGVRATY